MVRTFSKVILTICFVGAVVLSSLALSAHSAHAATRISNDCPSTPLSYTNVYANGNPTGDGSKAQVNMTLWQDCHGHYYASANSFTDDNGFAFHGTVSLWWDNNGVDYQIGSSTTCNRAGICNSGPTSGTFTSGNAIYGEYTNNNGVFFDSDANSWGGNYVDTYEGTS